METLRRRPEPTPSGTDWSNNQKTELINEFNKTPSPPDYIEFEVRSKADNIDSPDGTNNITTGEKIRIYREDVWKSISDIVVNPAEPLESINPVLGNVTAVFP